MSTSTPQKFHEVITALIDGSPYMQTEIAKKLGYRKPNIITMFKQGRTPVPINKIPALARALEVDPTWLMRLALQEYHPGLLDTIASTLGFLVTAREIEIIEALREATGNSDPKFGDPGQRAKLEELATALVR